MSFLRRVAERTINSPLAASHRELCGAFCLNFHGREIFVKAASICSLECQGVFDSQRLQMCQDILLDEENGLSLDTDPYPQQDQEKVVTIIDDSNEEQSPEHQIAKKYGDFIKRYGGFMSRRASSPEETLDDLKNQDEEENIRSEILKIISTAGDHGGEGNSHGGEVVKRYGGFMRRNEGGVTSADLLKAVLDRGLKKRYGGFMRRVGRPEWLVDNKNGGMMKRSWKDGSMLQKRYGGFMD